MDDISVVENRVEESSINEVTGEHVETAVTSGKEAESSSVTLEGKGRQKHKCPYPSCSSKVVHLPRHMWQKHKWDGKDAVGVLNMFGLRAERKRTSTKRKRVFKGRMCPIDGCASVVKRIHNHLTDVHNKKRGSKEYKNYLKMAVVYQGKDISESSESTPDSSSSEEDVKETASRRKHAKTHKPKERREFYKQVYSSDEETSRDEYPSIFQDHPVEKETLANPPTRISEKNPSCSDQFESPGAEDVFSDDRDGEFVDDNDNDENDDGEFADDDDDDDNDDDDDDEFADDDDDDLDEGETETPRSQQEMFKHFREWLQGADGGRKEEHVANQCSRQVEMVVEYIDRENRDVQNILSKRILRDKWLTPFEKKKRPGTIKSYLASLNHFYIFKMRKTGWYCGN